MLGIEVLFSSDTPEKENRLKVAEVGSCGHVGNYHLIKIIRSETSW